jgi:hypothetical protein
MLFYRNAEKAFFDEWITNQVDNILILSEDDTFSFREVSSISISEDGSVEVQIEGGTEPFDLYSNRADNSGRFKISAKEFEQIEIDHVRPMREILDENKENLPVLCDITKRIYREAPSINTGKELKDISSALLKNGTINKRDIPGLKAELEWIAPQIRLQLMIDSENSKKHNK